MKMYDIIKLEDSEYNGLVIMCSANSPKAYLSLIYSELKEKNVHGKIIIDEILHVGNTNKRFMYFEFNENSLLDDVKIKFVDIKKGNTLRKISCEYLRVNGLVEYSILSSIQKRMINIGIAI